jgi:hypothetical protein
MTSMLTIARPTNSVVDQELCIDASSGRQGIKLGVPEDAVIVDGYDNAVDSWEVRS